MNKTWTIIIVVLVLVAGVWWFNGGSSNVAFLPGLSASPSVSATKTPGVVKRTATPTVTSNLTYSQLVAQYGNNRIQFNSSCQAVPSSLVLKNGTGILLDNRSNMTQVISLNGATYTLVPYGYRVVTLTSSLLPTSLSISCNSSVNTGTIQLQAKISGE